jgi:hypothetical protein
MSDAPNLSCPLAWRQAEQGQDTRRRTGASLLSVCELSLPRILPARASGSTVLTPKESGRGLIMDLSVAPQVVTAASTLGAVALTLWISGRRDRRLRNHTERTQTASAYFATFDAVRRALRDGLKHDITTESRALADVAVRMELYFDEPVTVAMEHAEHALGLEQPKPDAAKTARDQVIAIVKRELEPKRSGGRRG